jgi:hypothetical protein
LVVFYGALLEKISGVLTQTHSRDPFFFWVDKNKRPSLRCLVFQIPKIALTYYCTFIHQSLFPPDQSATHDDRGMQKAQCWRLIEPSQSTCQTDLLSGSSRDQTLVSAGDGRSPRLPPKLHTTQFFPSLLFCHVSKTYKSLIFLPAGPASAVLRPGRGWLGLSGRRH